MTKLLSVLSFAAVVSLPLTAVRAKDTPAPAPEQAAKAKPGKLILDKGTRGEDILKHYGKPFEVKELDSPDKSLRVEQWIYRRKVDEKVTQEHLADSSETYNFTVRSSNGNGATMPVTISNPVLKSKRLMLVNGCLEWAMTHSAEEHATRQGRSLLRPRGRTKVRPYVRAMGAK